jgi:ATP-dependent DNA helicase RecG
MDLTTPIEEIPRVGPQYQKRLKKLGIKTVRDLLFHFPHRYEDFSNLVPISEAKLGETVSIQGKILEIENTRTWKKRMILTQALVQDNSGAIKVVWFNQPYLINVLKPGDDVCLAGKVTLGKEGIYLSSPAYEKISNQQLTINNQQLTHTGRLVPVYPETEGLSSRWLRLIIKPLLFKFKNKIPEFLPEEIKKEKKLLSLERALWQIHFPDSRTLAKAAKRRFSFEDLFLLHLFILRERIKLAKEKSPAIPLNLELIKEFVKSLPFQLTESQKKSAWQILKDLESDQPMNRLLEGDVGSGKTVVAAMAALSVAKAGYQVAFMAPTEILAKQHFKTFNGLLKNFGIKIGLLTGDEKIKGGDILIGTHALIQDQIKFKNLALVIVDEQHRFGVEQRAKLCEQKDYIPHLLSMTATPIPRTLALTIYGDLDLSLITELPKGRKKIITKVIPPEKRRAAYDFIRKQVKLGRQVFVICPRIEPSEIKTKNLSWAEVKAVKDEYQKLSKEVFPDLKIGMLHGRMKTEEKEEIMKKFKQGKTDVLVSTSVVEVGIDIPNATVMMIEGAERFGLAQLHQFRGRVGRSKYQSYCFLFTESPAKKTAQRLKALLDCENGFALSEKDLEIRGPGDFTGQRQWGIPDLAMDSLKDIFLVQETRQTAKEILEEDSELKKYPLLRERLKEFGERIHLE